MISERIEPNGDKVYILNISPEQMIYMGYILESLEGWAFHTNRDQGENILRVEIIKDYVNEFEELFKKIDILQK